MGFGVVGLEGDGLTVGGDGLVELALARSGHCRDCCGLREVGLEGDGLTIGGDGLVELAPLSQRIAEIAVGFGIIGLEGDGLTAGGDRFVQLPSLLQGNAEIAVGFGVVGLDGREPGELNPPRCRSVRPDGNRPRIAQALDALGLLAPKFAGRGSLPAEVAQFYGVQRRAEKLFNRQLRHRCSGRKKSDSDSIQVRRREKNETAKLSGPGYEEAGGCRLMSVTPI